MMLRSFPCSENMNIMLLPICLTKCIACNTAITLFNKSLSSCHHPSLLCLAHTNDGVSSGNLKRGCIMFIGKHLCSAIYCKCKFNIVPGNFQSDYKTFAQRCIIFSFHRTAQKTPHAHRAGDCIFRFPESAARKVGDSRTSCRYVPVTYF